MAASTYLRLIEIENFKSFGSHIQIPLSPGFTLVHGPNGTGKSNLLDAICCAFGCEPRLLRVSSYQELLNTQGLKTSQSAFVALHVMVGTKEDIVRVDITQSEISWSLNNKPQTLKEIRAYGIHHGFNFSEGSLGIIRQNYVSHLLDDPKLLSDAIENANGSKTLLASIQTANAELLQSVESHKELQKSLSVLQQRVNKEENKRNIVRSLLEALYSEDLEVLQLHSIHYCLDRLAVLSSRSSINKFQNEISEIQVFSS